MTLKILNLYAGIGGNRKLWTGDIKVTAVENVPGIAAIYKDFFPEDEVIICDAHQYLLDHYDEFDFIWSSPPCPSHSQLRFNLGFKANRKYAKVKAIYPDLTLYQEIILLKHWFKGKWVVENTVPYYEPLVAGIKTGGHIWWANFHIDNFNHGNRNHRGGTVSSLQERKMFDISKYDVTEKRKILRNCVEPETGLFVFECAFKEGKDKQDTLNEETTGVINEDH
jgi:DNA (cytosine-5)-methyltransferase 1